jgi:hypothetical protein
VSENPESRRDAVIASLQEQFGKADQPNEFWENLKNKGAELTKGTAEWLRQNTGAGTAAAAELTPAQKLEARKAALQSPEGRTRVERGLTTVAERTEQRTEKTLEDKLKIISTSESPKRQFEELIKLISNPSRKNLP